MAIWDKDLTTIYNDIIPETFRDMISLEDLKKEMKKEVVEDIKRDPEGVVDFYLDSVSKDRTVYGDFIQKVIEKLAK